MAHAPPPGERLDTALTASMRRGEPYASQRRAWRELAARVREERGRIALGGGERAVERQHGKGRMTARERIDRLLDPGADFDELMSFAGWEMYPDEGPVPAGGVVTGMGRLHGRPWMIIANDATVKAGAFFPITAKKVIRAQTIALENRLPVIYLVDSAGVYLPLQDEIFPDQDDFGRVFYLNARMSAAGVVQFAAILGNCVAGGAYLPVMCDALVMSEGSGLYLAGPALVRAAIGQVVDSETLGGTSVHGELSGTADYVEPDDGASLARLRELAGHVAPPRLARWAGPVGGEDARDGQAGRRPPHEPALDPADLTGILPAEGGASPYDVREVIGRLVDDSRFDEYKRDWGKTLVCGHATLGGHAVGVVANQRVTTKRAGRLEVGGVIYPEAADKAARFVMVCNQLQVPILFLHDVSGFMIGKESERDGMIRRGAKLVQAVSNSVVPRIAVILGGSFGAGHYAMSGRAYAPRFLFALPSARYAVMGGQQAAKTILDLQAARLKRLGEPPDDEALAELHARIRDDYERTLDPRWGAARLWLDELILPDELRARLIGALEACAHDADPPPMRTGVLQV